MEVNLIDCGDAFRLEVALPGVLESDIDVLLLRGRIVIRAERPAEAGRYLLQEIRRGRLVREIALDDPVDLVRGRYEDGVLTLELRRV